MSLNQLSSSSQPLSERATTTIVIHIITLQNLFFIMIDIFVILTNVKKNRNKTYFLNVKNLLSIKLEAPKGNIPMKLARL